MTPERTSWTRYRLRDFASTFLHRRLLAIVRDDEQRIGAPLGTPHASAQLVKLGEPEAVSAMHDQLLMTVPGVGPVVALTYRVTVDVPARFRSSKAVGAVFGLTPAKHQSGELNRTGAISRCGDEMMRMMLYEAAQIMLVRSTK